MLLCLDLIAPQGAHDFTVTACSFPIGCSTVVWCLNMSPTDTFEGLPPAASFHLLEAALGWTSPATSRLASPCKSCSSLANLFVISMSVTSSPLLWMLSLRHLQQITWLLACMWRGSLLSSIELFQPAAAQCFGSLSLLSQHHFLPYSRQLMYVCYLLSSKEWTSVAMSARYFLKELVRTKKRS